VTEVGRQFAPDKRGGRAYGSNNLETMFPDNAPTTSLPHDNYNQRRGYDQDAVKAALSRPPTKDEIVDVDPRTVRVSQPKVTREGVQYYSGDDYENTGRTYADQGNVGNQHPVVYSRHDGSEDILLSGHHRMIASLIKGKALRARRISGP
jgi:ketosteroid isomerase-like protein